MNLDDFIKKYEGKTKGYPDDSHYLGECLSLVKLYIKEVFNLNPPSSGSNSAYGYWSNFPNPLGTVFKKVAKTPDGVPEKGDIPIWSTNHIDIFIEGTAGSFTGFDQNWNGKQAHLQDHYYTNIIGWLTPKGGIVSDYYKGIDLNNKESLKVCIDTWKDVVDGNYADKDEVRKLEKKIEAYDNFYNDLKEIVRPISADFPEMLGSAQSLADKAGRIAQIDQDLKEFAGMVNQPKFEKEAFKNRLRELLGSETDLDNLIKSVDQMDLVEKYWLLVYFRGIKVIAQKKKEVRDNE